MDLNRTVGILGSTPSRKEFSSRRMVSSSLKAERPHATSGSPVAFPFSSRFSSIPYIKNPPEAFAREVTSYRIHACPHRHCLEALVCTRVLCPQGHDQRLAAVGP